MDTPEFKTAEQSHKDMLRAALEVATADASLSSYRIQKGSIEVDPDVNRELSKEEIDMMEMFRTDVRNEVEAVVRSGPANEGFLDFVTKVSVKQVFYEVATTIMRIRNAVRVYGVQAERLNGTLKACQARLKRNKPKEVIDLDFEFGAYSRFFHLGNVPCDSFEAFVQAIYVHRATSEWCSLHAANAVKDVYALAEKTFTALTKSAPAITAAMSDAMVARSGEIVMSHFSDELRAPVIARNFVHGSPEVPKGYKAAKDVILQAKGYMLDAGVLCVSRPSKSSMQPAWGAVIVRDEDINRTKAQGFTVRHNADLLSLVEHGIEITSNATATIKDLDKLCNDVLKPLEEALRIIFQRLNLRNEEEKNLMISQASIGKLLCNVTANPLMSALWLDLRLVRMISGIAEIYFVKDPNKRIVFKQNIAEA